MGIKGRYPGHGKLSAIRFNTHNTSPKGIPSFNFSENHWEHLPSHNGSIGPSSVLYCSLRCDIKRHDLYRILNVWLNMLWENYHLSLLPTAIATSDDESDALNDQHQEYPFRAFAYCVMKTLRSTHGDKAIEAVKSEKTHSRKHWKQTLLDRDNEFRALHGSPPFKRVTELDQAAQKWADKNAAECDSDHSKNEDPGRLWRGKGTGESLSAGGGPDEKENAAYIASDGWYEENTLYPFPGGIKDGKDPRFHDVGHFTQTIWKSTEYVGYGYAYNPNCKPFTHYIAARYSPAGNLAGAFQENVVPRQ
ncbi:unnamed protein product [Orchesella dallaii]|uniref:SCP domain-containing protein n=1 Tax=Orchesella dallaii TaxID=48710 RepID=A0ABP1PI35_9HEXA